MGNLEGFNAEEYEPQQDFSPIPAGVYQVAILESEMRATKAGTGRYLLLTMEVLDGEHAGRRLWDRLNLDNPNETAMKIAQQTLASICRAVGVIAPSDSSDLHSRPMLAKVTIKAASGGYEASNEIKGYSAIDKAPAPTAPTAAPSAPWRKR